MQDWVSCMWPSTLEVHKEPPKLYGRVWRQEQPDSQPRPPPIIHRTVSGQQVASGLGSPAPPCTILPP